MFRMHRSKTNESGERIDFRFSGFQANQVPKGWDKLFVSIISVETGKTVAKSSKALVRNGICQWRETLTESIWVGQDHSSKELEDCSFKFVIAMGSARSGILGETTVNVTRYMDSPTPVPLSVPLKKCSHGTSLQVNLQCIAPRNQSREGADDASSHSGDLNADTDAKSEGSQGSFTRSFGYSSGKDMDSNTQAGETPRRGTSFSASDSRRSSISGDGSIGRGTFSPRNVLNSVRQDTAGLPHITYNGFVEESSRSSYSASSSKDTGSEFGQITILKNVGSSKSLLEAAENTIEEIRAEAKMWERNARKLMLDLDILRKEFLDQSSSKADLVLELSAAQTETDGLKKEIKQLELSLEELKLKHKAPESSTSRSQIEKGLEDEIKFNRESNSELSLQLTKAQESNIELVSILQELEETIEDQKIEIQELSALNSKLRNTESSIQDNLEENKMSSAELQRLEDSETFLSDKVQSLEQTVQEMTSELENERNLKSQLQGIMSELKCKLSIKDEEILSLEAKLSAFLEKGHVEETVPSHLGNTDLNTKVAALEDKVQELERDCAELTDENLELLFKLKKLQNSAASEGELPGYLTTDHSPKAYVSSGAKEAEMEKKTIMEDVEALDTSKICSEIFKQLQMAFSALSNQQYKLVNGKYDRWDNIIDMFEFEDAISFKERARLILTRMTEFNKVLEATISDCNNGLTVSEVEVRKNGNQVLEVRKDLEASIVEVHDLSFALQEFEKSKTLLEEKEKELIKQRSQITQLENDFRSIEELNGVLQQRQIEFEARFHELEEEKARVQDHNEVMSTERATSSKRLNDLQNELLALNRSLDLQLSANKTVQKKVDELETGKQDLELHISELERQNVQQSERISGLEAQLRHFTNEKESIRLDLEKSQRLALTLQDEISNARTEMERQLSDHEQKMEKMHKRLLEDQEEIEYLKAANSKLQTTAESVMEECDSLQKSNAKLRSHKLELHEHCTRLEGALRDTTDKFASCSKKVDILGNDLSVMLEDLASKEKSLSSELDALLEENRQHKEKFRFGESLLNQLYEDKTLEAERLQREVNHLTQQIYSTYDERETMASNAVQEVSNLTEDNAKLGSVLQEAQLKASQLENELNDLRTESEMKVESLMVEMSASKQSYELMKADHEKMSKMVEKCKSSEEKLKTYVNNLELKLTVCEYEHQQLLEETASLKIRLEKMENLQDEVTSLRTLSFTARLEKEKLETSLRLKIDECEILKAEKLLLTEKVSVLEKAASDFEECKHSKNALEEKLLRLEGDLIAKEATCAEDVELKNELNRAKRENRQLQRKIEQMEEDKDDLLKNFRATQEELKLLREANHAQNTKKELRTTDQHNQSRKQESFKVSQGPERGERTTNDDQYQGQVNGSNLPKELESDSVSRIQVLENELADALEAIQLYKLQIKRLSEGGNIQVMARSKSSLEAELRDIQERYFQMSLKYAEVEAQREELVMKLKAARGGKKWF